VPSTSSEAVLGDNVLAGHPGIDGKSGGFLCILLALFADVAHFACSCAVCAASKSSNQLQMGAESFSSIPLQPFTSWAMDLIGPLPATKSGHTWIVTWVDCTFKMIVAAAAKERQISSGALALMTFREICCRFGLSLHVTINNDVKFVSSLWQSPWNLYGTKLRFTSGYNPQSDPAERANRQVLEAFRAAVAIVVQYDEWDEALPRVTFGLNMHVSTATKVSPFEFAHSFPARVPLTMGLSERQEYSDDEEAVSLVQRVENRYKATSDHMAASQVRLGHLLENHSVASSVVAGDKVWLNSKCTPIDIPYKLSAHWFGSFQVLSADGVAIMLDLPETFGKAHRKVNIRRIKFYKQKDSCFGEADGHPELLITSGGVARYEVHRISNPRIQEGQSELWVEWKGYNQSPNCWVHRDILIQMSLSWSRPSMRGLRCAPTLKARTSVSKRATKITRHPLQHMHQGAARACAAVSLIRLCALLAYYMLSCLLDIIFMYQCI